MTGWSPRMLRYVERIGLVAPRRSEAGYRLYGPEELQRLRTLRELLERFDVGLGEIGFALRLRRESELREAVETWFEAEPQRPSSGATARRRTRRAFPCSPGRARRSRSTGGAPSRCSPGRRRAVSRAGR